MHIFLNLEYFIIEFTVQIFAKISPNKLFKMKMKLEEMLVHINGLQEAQMMKKVT